ncbi:MAG: ABC-type transport auxiliary lipoprotein family protein [Bacteroidota bacterium]
MRQYILLSFLAAVILASCGTQKEVIKKYYIIEAPNDSTSINKESTPLLDAWCEVADVAVYPAFNSRRIVLRDESHQIRYFGNHEWAVTPDNFLTPMIIDFLAANKVFTRVGARFWERVPDYRLQTTIFNLEVVTNKKNSFDAHLNLKIDLIDVETDAIVLTHSSDRKLLLDEKDLNLLASAISDIFYQELGNFSVQIKETLQK